jgi:DNA primase
LADDQVSLVKQANDIVEVIGEYVSLRRRGGKHLGLCPFHDDHTPSMTVDSKWQSFKCWACGKSGDVFTFVMERERVDFREALELLARRANIPLKRGPGSAEHKNRLQMLDLMKWAEERYHQFLLTAAGAEAARNYLAERHLSTDTIQKYGIGYAPDSWTWLAKEARKKGWSDELLIEVGLCGTRESDGSCFDRFRDRVMFPIRDVRGRTIGFGGRILPSSSAAGEAPKYYNSSDTPLFTKSEHLYGLDQARATGEKEGYLAVVEGYTDVLMAHQVGVLHVVATLGTALNVRHIQQLRRFVPRVVLVFDADAGGERGVDQALELFISQDVDLAVATLPAGLDPCDLLVQQGPEPFRAALGQAVDALDFKLTQVMTAENMASVAGQTQAVDSILRVLAAAPEMPGQAGSLRRDLVVSRVAQRARLDVQKVWDRFRELARTKRPPARVERPQVEPRKQAPADPAERELLEVLLAEPGLAARARAAVSPEDLQHPGLKRLLLELYTILAGGQVPDVDLLRARLADNAPLAEHVLRLQSMGQVVPQRSACLEQLIDVFRERRIAAQTSDLRGQLQSVPSDAPVPVELFRQLQRKRSEV